MKFVGSQKFNLWTGSGSCIEEKWKSFKGIKRYVLQKILNKNPDPEGSKTAKGKGEENV